MNSLSDRAKEIIFDEVDLHKHIKGSDLYLSDDIKYILDSENIEYDEAEVDEYIEKCLSGEIKKDMPAVIIEPDLNSKFAVDNIDDIDPEFTMNVEDALTYLDTHFDDDDLLVIKADNKIVPVTGSTFKKKDNIQEDLNMASGYDCSDGDVAAMRAEQKEKEARAARKASNPKVKVGDKIKIIKMEGEPKYTNKQGIIDHIDDIGQLHGTWGSLAVIPEEDIYELVVEESLTDTTQSDRKERYALYHKLFDEYEQINPDDPGLNRIYSWIRDAVEFKLLDRISDLPQEIDGQKVRYRFSMSDKNIYTDPYKDYIFVVLDKGLRESLGSDYSHIPNVEAINYTNPAGPRMPGLNERKFKKALEEIGLDAFKIRSSQLKSVSHADLRDAFATWYLEDNPMYPWKFFKDWDTSEKGFNEFYFFYKGSMPKDPKKLKEDFDLEDERDILMKAQQYKCKLRKSDIEEALEPKDLIEDMEYIYNKLCGKYDDVNIKYWRFTEDGIAVKKSDGQVVRIEDDEFDKFYSKGITESWKKGDRVVLSTGETGTVYKDFDWQNEDQVAVQIDGMNKIKYPLSDTLTALRESNELEKRAKHHAKHQDGMSPFYGLSEEYEFILPYASEEDSDNQWKAAKRYNLKYTEHSDNGGYIKLTGSKEALEKYCDAHGQDCSNITLVKKTELDEAKKKKKPYSSINKNAGNVEHNIKMFNMMSNATESPSTNPTGPMGESVDDVSSTYKENYPNYKGIYIVWKIFLHDGISNRWIKYAEGASKRESTAMKHAQSALAKIYSDNKAYSVQDFHDVENEYEDYENPCEDNDDEGYYLTRCLEPDIYYYDEDEYILGEDWWRVTFDYIDTTMEESIKEDMKKAANEYTITYHKNTACRDRRPETIDDVENDWVEAPIRADSDLEALQRAIAIMTDYDIEDISDDGFEDEASCISYLDEADWGDGSPIIIKVESSDKVLYDTGYDKQSWIGEYVDDDFNGSISLTDSMGEDIKSYLRDRLEDFYIPEYFSEENKPNIDLVITDIEKEIRSKYPEMIDYISYWANADKAKEEGVPEDIYDIIASENFPEGLIYSYISKLPGFDEEYNIAESLNEARKIDIIKSKWDQDQDEFGDIEDEGIYSIIAKYFNADDIDCWYWRKDYSGDRPAVLVIEINDSTEYFEEHNGHLHEIEYLDESLNEARTEAAPRKEKVEIYYPELTFTQYGAQRDADDWDEWDVTKEYMFEVDKNDLYTYIFEWCIDESDFAEAFDNNFNPNDQEDWSRFVKWLDANFESIYNKYEEKILDEYEDEAREEAAENYDPEDEIDWDLMPGGHDDYDFWHGLNESRVSRDHNKACRQESVQSYSKISDAQKDTLRELAILLRSAHLNVELPLELDDRDYLKVNIKNNSINVFIKPDGEINADEEDLYISDEYDRDRLLDILSEGELRESFDDSEEGLYTVYIDGKRYDADYNYADLKENAIRLAHDSPKLHIEIWDSNDILLFEIKDGKEHDYNSSWLLDNAFRESLTEAVSIEDLFTETTIKVIDALEAEGVRPIADIPGRTWDSARGFIYSRSDDLNRASLGEQLLNTLWKYNNNKPKLIQLCEYYEHILERFVRYALKID